MKEVITLTDGRANRAWEVHCPHCRERVRVSGERAVNCPSCGTSFQPDGMPTAAMATRDGVRSDPDDSLVGMTLGRFELLRLIGRGGMGRVYEAREVGSSRFGTRRKVALKVLNEELASDPAFVKRFRREARLLSGLSHPHVVQVLEQGETDGRIWFAMEYVRGENLRRRMERGALEPREAGRIASEIASALAYAHERGIVHRDLKPENVLLDADGVVHLVDFGLSRLVAIGSADHSTRLTRTDVVMGTYEYMAPEQRRGDREVDARADIFALGVILYEMLTASLPLGRFALPSERVRTMPAKLDEVVGRALAPEATDRYPTATAFQAALAQAIESAPRAHTPPPTPPQPVVPDVVEARKILKHVDVLGVLDKVGGAIAFFLGIGFAVPFVIMDIGPIGEQPLQAILTFAPFALVIVGFFLWRQGGRLMRLQQGARESQLFWSAVLLPFPPVFTAIGIYGLVAMTSERARLAFDLGRDVVGSTSGTHIVRQRILDIERPQHPQQPRFLVRAFHFLAVIWSLYAAFVGLELLMLGTRDAIASPVTVTVALDHAEFVRDATIVAAGIAGLLVLHTFVTRRQRRGLGLAILAFVFLMSAAGLLLMGVEDARALLQSDLTLWTHELLPRALASAPIPTMPPLLETLK